MKVVERRVLRGPNIYAARPVYLAVVDLEALDDVASNAIPGFIEALLAAVPTLHKHRCSPGYVGGFVERLHRGTYMAHIVEHLALELQCLAGMPVGFGKARMVAGRPRHYRVLFAYVSERAAEAALNLAIEYVTAFAVGKTSTVDDGVAQLRQLAQAAALGPSTRAIVDAARQRGIPSLRLTEEANLFQLGWGIKQQRIQATTTSKTNHIAVGIASDKGLTKRLLEEAGLPVPRGQTVSTLDAAHAAAQRANGRVAIKPLCGNQGKGVTTAVSDAKAVAAAFGRAQQYGRRVIVEQHIEGDDYRVLVIGQEVVAAARRLPPEVIGDGQSTVRQLVDVVNAGPRRGDGHENALTRIRLDEAAAEELVRQGLDADSVPSAGQVVRLRCNANLSTGGTAQDVTGKIHPDTALACVRAARKVGLDVAGIDVVCPDIGLPLLAQGGAIIEVNAAPGIRMHEQVNGGERHRAGRAIVDSLFSADDDGRVPIVAVTGSNGKTTTTLSIAHVVQRIGYVTGVATTVGITVAGRCIKVGDCTGYWSARTVLTSPEVEFAVLETARGGILKRGLGFDKCDVGIVLNVHNDHLGQDGIETIDDLARVKGLLAATARKAVVLNADDALCVQLASRAPRGTEVIFFGFDAAHPAMAAHLARGGRAVYAEDGMLTWADGEHHVPLIAAAQLPSTLDGRARHNVANAMAAFAALLALEVPRERIAAGLASFSTSERQTPLRLNLFRTRGITVMVDYAHNAAAYEAIIATGRQLTQGRLIGVVAAPCDRRTSDLNAIGKVCGAGFDGLVIYEMDDLRQKNPGETAGLIARGVSAARQTGAPTTNGRQWVHAVLDIRAAIRDAIGRAEPGDLIIIGCASYVSELREALGTVDLSPIETGDFGVYRRRRDRSGVQDPQPVAE
ncbi:MAG: cyanophycin synthetase [Woeseia sp.]